MKNINSLIIFLFISSNTFAQFNSDLMEYLTISNRKIRTLYFSYSYHSLPVGIKSIKYTEDKKVTLLKISDNKLSSISILRKDKEVPLLVLEYNTFGKINSLILINNNGTKNHSIEFTYNNKGLKTGKKIINKRGKIINNSEFKFDSNDNLIKRINYKKSKITSKWIHEYDENGDKISTRSYNKKGNLKSEFTYDCNPEGRNVEKKVDYKLVCSSTESTKDFLIKTDEQNNLRGKVTRTIKTYLAADTSIVEMKKYDHKDRLNYKYNYSPSGKMTDYEWHKRGKLLSTNHWEYNDDKFISRQYYWKGKPKSRLEYIYKDELVAKVKRYNKEKLAKTTTIEYEF